METVLTYQQFRDSLQFMTMHQFNETYGYYYDLENYEPHQCPTVHVYGPAYVIEYYSDIMTGPYAQLVIGNQVWSTKDGFNYNDLVETLYAYYVNNS